MFDNNSDIYRDLSVEQRLIIVLCKLIPSTDDTAFIESTASSSIDWTYIINFADLHGVTSLLYSNLTKYPDVSVPVEVVDTLKSRSLENSKKNLFLTSVLLEITKELKQMELKVVPFKGPVLSKLLYDDITVREFTDLDILVYKEDVLRIKEYLVQNGYRPQFDLNDIEQDYYLNSKYYYINFTREDDRVALDLHWAMSSPNYGFSQGLNYFYDSLDSLKINNVAIAVLKTEDLFLQLCIHGAKHNFSRFNWIADIANLVLCKNNMDFEYVSKEARKLGCSRILSYSTSLINNLFGLKMQNMGIQGGDYKQISATNRMYGLKDRQSETGSLFPTIFDSNMDKLKFYTNNYIYPTPIELSYVSLNQNMFFLYYLIRVVRMCYRGILNLIKP